MTDGHAEKSLEVVTFGETMGLLMPEGAAGIEHAHRFEKSFGGAESNAAIGLARLGHRVGWFSRLGHDPIGRHIFKTVRGEGIDVSQVTFSETASTGLMLREQSFQGLSVYYYRKHSAASELGPEHIDEAYIRQAKILHITGITPALSPTCREAVWKAVEIARKHKVKISFDPNLRLKLWSLEEARTVLLRLAEMADYFLPGLDELHLLYETDDWERIRRKLERISAVSIVKGGESETMIVSEGTCEAVPYIPVKQVVDPVGAGDAFCAGFLSGVLRGFDLPEAVRLGNLNGSIVIQSQGDWEALPDWTQVQSFLRRDKHVER